MGADHLIFREGDIYDNTINCCLLNIVFNSIVMKHIGAAARLAGFDKPTIWSTMTPLAIKTNSVNLGQGFPAWEPPAFFTKYLQESVGNSKS